MIFDNILYFEKYLGIHPHFKKAFEFLLRDDLAKLPEGVYTLIENELMVTVVDAALKSKESAFLESHRDFIDIQFLISGEEQFGLRSLNYCRMIQQEYDKERDIAFWDDTPHNFVKLIPNDFVILFPEDAHAPLIGSGGVRKIIIKVRVQV